MRFPSPTTHFRSARLNFLHLASIQSASIGLTGIIIGQHLATQFGPGIAISSIALGNLILWLIGVAMISMSDRGSTHAIDNIRNYLGTVGGMLAAFILLLAFLNWYAAQINFSIGAIQSLFQPQTFWEKGLSLRCGAALGFVAALLSIGGISLLKTIALFSMPLLFGYHIYSIATSHISPSFEQGWGLSMSATLLAVLLLLPGVINLPTFFRHARSKAHSLLALTLLTICITFFEISTIWMQLSNPIESTGTFNLIVTTLFFIVILTLCNLLNIYLASACWETIVPRFDSAKGYAIIGLIGTLIYTFIQISTPVQLFEDLTNSYIACLGVVLLMAYLIRMLVQHRPRPLEKLISLITWIWGCTMATIYEASHFLEGIPSLLVGVNSSVLFLLSVLFIEETTWAVKKKFAKANKS